MSEPSVREKVCKILRHNALFSKEQESLIDEMAGTSRHTGHMDHPSGYTMLCIHALLEHIERLEAASESREKRLRALCTRLKEAQGEGDVLPGVGVSVDLVEALLDAEETA